MNIHYKKKLHLKLTGPCILGTSINKNQFTVAKDNNHDFASGSRLALGDIESC